MSEIQVNAHVLVPKRDDGLPDRRWRGGSVNSQPGVRVAKIVDVDVKSNSFYLLLPDEMRLRYFESSAGKRQIDPDILEFTDP